MSANHNTDDDDDDDLVFIQRTFYVDIIKCALQYYTGDLINQTAACECM